MKVVLTAQGVKAQKFGAIGEEIDVSPERAERWLDRGFVVKAGTSKPAAAKPAKGKDAATK